MKKNGALKATLTLVPATKRTESVSLDRGVSKSNHRAHFYNFGETYARTDGPGQDD
jgi:hypothetical protein